MQNNLDGLNETLFDTLNKLKAKEIDVKQANAIVNVSNTIVKNASIQLTAFKMMNGQIEAPKVITKNKVFATLGSGDTHTQKTEYAKTLGYKDIPEAIDKMGLREFNQSFKDEFKAA